MGPRAGRPNFKHLFSCFRVVKEITGLSRGFLPLIYSGNKKTFRRPTKIEGLDKREILILELISSEKAVATKELQRVTKFT